MAGRKPRKPAQPSRRRNRRAEAAATPWWSLGPPGPDEPPDLFGMGIVDDLLAEIVAERESQISIRKRGRPTKKQKALDEANTLVGVAEGFEGERAREIATKSLGLSPDCALARLDAEDRIVARFMHLDLLISHGRFAAAKQLCDECREEVFCVWPYGRALIAFGEQGDTPAARQLLAEASVVNPHVPRLLLSGREFDPGGMITVGAEDEAAAYVRDFRSCWMDVPGALAWLRACGNVPLENAGRDDRQLALDVLEDRPLPDDLWGMLADAMRRPRHGEPRRPATVAMRPGVLPKTWRRKLEQIGVSQILREELGTIALISSDVTARIAAAAADRDADTTEESLPAIDHAIASLAESMTPPEAVAPLSAVPGITTAIGRAFYAAAAAFHRDRPWRRLPSDVAINVHVPAADGSEGSRTHADARGARGD